MIRINYILPSASDIQVNWNVVIFLELLADF